MQPPFQMKWLWDFKWVATSEPLYQQQHIPGSSETAYALTFTLVEE